MKVAVAEAMATEGGGFTKKFENVFAKLITNGPTTAPYKVP